jgi:hypothetical protein
VIVELLGLLPGLRLAREAKAKADASSVGSTLLWVFGPSIVDWMSLPIRFPLLIFMEEGAPWTTSSLSVFCFLGADERSDRLGAAGTSSNNRLLKVFEVLISSGFVADACGMVIQSLQLLRQSVREFGTIKVL